MKSPKKYYLLILFIFLFLLTRLPRLNNDIVSTDAVYWHDRSEKFVRALDEKEFNDTYQMYHPGVTLMWITGLTAKIESGLLNVSVAEVFDDFEGLHYKAKLVLVVWQLILSLFLIYLFSRIFDFTKALLMISLFTLEPFYIGNSRLLHLDAQISLYILIGLTLTYLSVQNFSWKKPALASIFFALAALSKTLFIGSFIFGLLFGTLLIFLKQDKIKALKYFGLVLLLSTVTYLLMFPAFWQSGSETLSIILKDSLEVGSEDGHKQIFFGEITRNPGFWFYPIVYVLKLSLVTSLGFILYLVTRISSFYRKLDFKNISFLTYAGIFYLGYFVLLSYFTKKVDRYIIPMLPFLSIAAVDGFYSLKYKIKNSIIILLILTTLVYPIFKSFPHYLTYINPIVGDAARGNEILGQKLFGIGIFDLRDHLVEEYGNAVKVAINDPGPLTSIRGDMTVYNIAEEHPNSYKVLVLGPNKEFPPSVVNSGVRFTKKDSIYINGLEFWRIYKKRN